MTKKTSKLATNSEDIEERYKKIKLSPEELFGQFLETTDCVEILRLFEELLETLSINKYQQKEVYTKLKSKLTSWKCQSLWDLIDARAKHAEYERGTVCSNVNVLIIGAGPIGLRTAIETALLGCKTVIVEKRTAFTRNNVLHLWPFLLTDFRSLGAKKFYGKFCAGSIDHISIKQLQSILLKVCLILGVEIHTGVEFKEIIEPSDDKGWRMNCAPTTNSLSQFEINVIVGADGKKDILPGFQQIEMRGALAIGVTCNFVNENTMAEAGVEEISGIAYQFNPKFFDDLKDQFGVGLENIVYYKDETHYFVMTVLKSSLLERGALKQDIADPVKLLDKQNVDLNKLVELTMDTVHYATNYKLPSNLKLVQNPNGTPDIAMFDFTSIKKAANASKIIERKGKRLLMTLVGDSLLQPFWPTGSGCGRGVLSALDAAWMIRLFGMNKSPLTVLWEREKVFKLLSGTSADNMQKNYKSYSIDPKTRYCNLDHVTGINVPFLKKLYDTDDPEHADYSLPETKKFDIGRATTMHPPRTRRKSAAKRRSLSSSSHKRRSDRTTLKEAKHVSKAKAAWEDKIPKVPHHGRPQKKSKPSESVSGSSSCLSSVSESEREEKCEPYQRAMSLRKRNQDSENLSDVFTEGSTENLDWVNDNYQLLSKQHKHNEETHHSSGHKHTHASTDRLGYKHGHGHVHGHDEKHAKGHTGVMRYLFGKGRGEHDVERRKSIAARKSLSKARRARRKSGTGSQSQPDDKETESLLPHPDHRTVTVRRKPPQGPRSDTSASSNKGAFDRQATLNNRAATKTAKDLIAAAEARDKNNGVKPGPNASDSLKRKAEDMSSDSKQSRSQNIPWKHCLPALEYLVNDNAKGVNQSNSIQDALQPAAIALLAIPLLLPCNVRMIGKTSSLLTDKRNMFARASLEKRETRKISLTRAGSVQRAVEQYKTKLEQESTAKRDFNQFKRNRSSGSLKKDGSVVDEKRSSFHSRSTEEPKPAATTENIIDTDDYEIIEMKASGLQLKEITRFEDEFDVVSGSEFRYDATDGVEKKRAKRMVKTKSIRKQPAEILQECLEELCNEQRPSTVIITLEILLTIHRSIIQNANIDRFYRIYTQGKDFETYIWNSEACRTLMKQIGWQVCGKFIVLSKSTSVQEAVSGIEDAKRSVEQLLQRRSSSGSKIKPNQSLSKTVPSIQLQSADANKCGQSKQEEDELKWKQIEAASSLRPEFISKEELFQLIDSLDESNIDPVIDQDCVKSSERFIGEEEYLIVDFTNKVNHSEDPKQVKKPRKNMSEDVYGKDGRRRRRVNRTEQQEHEEHSKTAENSSITEGRGDAKKQVISNTFSATDRSNDCNSTAKEDLYGPDGRRRRRSSNRSDRQMEKRIDDDPRANGSTRSIERSGEKVPPGRPRETTLKTSDVNRSTFRERLLQKRTEMDQENKLKQSVKVEKFEHFSPEHDSKIKHELKVENSGSSNDSGNDSGLKKKKKLVLKKGSMRRKRLEENGEIIKDDKRSLEKSGLIDAKHIHKDTKSSKKEPELTTNLAGNSTENTEIKVRDSAGLKNTIKTTGLVNEDSSDCPLDRPKETDDLTNGLANMVVGNGRSASMNKTDTPAPVSVSNENKKKEIVNMNGYDMVDAKKLTNLTAGEKAEKEKKRKFVLKVKRKKHAKQDTPKDETTEQNHEDINKIHSTGNSEDHISTRTVDSGSFGNDSCSIIASKNEIDLENGVIRNSDYQNWKVDFVANSVAEKSNEQSPVLEAKSKKKKFVLKRKKKS